MNFMMIVERYPFHLFPRRGVAGNLENLRPTPTFVETPAPKFFLAKCAPCCQKWNHHSMPDNFAFDVFLSHSSKDKAVVRPLAERLRKDGVKVWFDEWEIMPGDSIPAKIEEGLEHSRVLVLCMSANAFGSDWAQLESGTFRFRDPLNKERRFTFLRCP
jgi:hypothetical protein